MYDKGKFGETLKKLRIEKGMSQADLADIINTNRSTLANYESGNRNPDNEILYNLSKALDVSSDYLLGISETKNRNANAAIAAKYTGLSEKALNKLIDYKEAVNIFLELESTPDFLECLNKLFKIGQRYRYFNDIVIKYRMQEYEEDSSINLILDHLFYCSVLSFKDMYQYTVNEYHELFYKERDLESFISQKYFFNIIDEIMTFSLYDNFFYEEYNIQIINDLLYLSELVGQKEVELDGCDVELSLSNEEKKEIIKFIEHFKEEEFGNGKHNPPKE